MSYTGDHGKDDRLVTAGGRVWRVVDAAPATHKADAELTVEPQ